MRLYKNTTPLCYLPCGKLVCYKQGDILVLNDEHVEKKFSIFHSIKERIIGVSRYLFRFLRLGVRAAIAIDDNNIIISVGNMLYELNLCTEKISKGYYCGEGIRPLILTESKGIDAIDNGIYFGGYLGNRTKKQVHIYKRIGSDQWKVVYTFPHGTINHVHNILSDRYRNCLWVYTGDFDEASAIWKVTSNFKNVERVSCNDQKYRGCVAFALPEGLLYATDAPFADNFIYLMNTDTNEVKELYPIDGSCIYGCKWIDKFVFSSSVEPDGRYTTKWVAMFGRTRGAGIKNEYVHMYSGNLKEGFKEIYKEKKDWLPYCSFQFGVFRFPYGDNNRETLYFQPISTDKNDQVLMAIK